MNEKKNQISIGNLLLKGIDKLELVTESHFQVRVQDFDKIHVEFAVMTHRNKKFVEREHALPVDCLVIEDGATTELDLKRSFSSVSSVES